MNTITTCKNAKEHFIALFDNDKLKCIVTPNNESIVIQSTSKDQIKSYIPTKEAYSAIVPYLGYPVIETHIYSDGAVKSITKFLYALEVMYDGLLFKTIAS
jgi:hypothetical protein